MISGVKSLKVPVTVYPIRNSMRAWNAGASSGTGKSVSFGGSVVFPDTVVISDKDVPSVIFLSCTCMYSGSVMVPSAVCPVSAADTGKLPDRINAVVSIATNFCPFFIGIHSFLPFR